MKSVINLIRTPQGFSLLDGDVEVNKPTNKPAKEKSYSMPKSTIYFIQSLRNKTLPSTPTSQTRSTKITNTSSFLPKPSGSI